MTEQAPPFLQITGLSKRFGPVTAIDKLDLTINRGELFALLGGSGCGKSTLLRILAGFERPSEGEIRIAGEDVSAMPPYARPVNMMFQSYALFPHMSVEENIAFGLRMEGVKTAERRRRVAEALELLHLTPFTKRKPHQLSGGQRQRVALARTIVKRPKLLLLDEPLSALDKNLREQSQIELVKIQSQVDITFIMVTHDQAEAMAMATRIAVMDRGRIVQSGPPQDIYENPVNRFVAGFVGAINMFEGQARDGLIESPEAGCAFAPVHPPQGGGQLWVGLRPETIRLAPLAEGAGANRASGWVEDVSYFGESSLFHIVLGGGARLRVTRLNPRRGMAHDLAAGDAVSLSWDPDSVIVMTQ